MKTRRCSPALAAACLITAAAGFILLHTTLPRLRAASAGTVRNDGHLWGGEGGTDAGHPQPAGSAHGAERRAWLERRLQTVLTQGVTLDETRALLALMQDMQPGDYPQVIGLLDQTPAVVRKELLEILFSGWAGCDPEAAMAYIREHPGYGHFAAGAWSGKDPEGAFEWAARHPGQGREAGEFSMLSMAATRILEKEPGRTAELLGRLDRKGCAELLAWLEEAKNPEIARASFLWAAGLKDPEEQRKAMEVLAARWDRIGYQFAFDQVLQHPESIDPAALNYPFQRWAGDDLPAAIRGMEQLPAGKMRGAALHGLMDGIVSESISSDSEKLEAIGPLLSRYPDDVDDETLNIWMARTPASFAAWMNSEDAPAALRARMEALQRAAGDDGE